MNSPQTNHPTTELPAGWEPAAGGPLPPYMPPPPGPPPGGGGPGGHDGGGQPRKRRTALIVSLTSLAVVLVLVIAAVGSELYLRNRFTSCTEKAFGELTGAHTSVELSSTPILWQWASGDIPSVKVDTSDGDESAIKLHGEATDVTTSGNGMTVKNMSASGFLPFARVTQMSGASAGTPNATAPDSGQGGTALTIQKITGNGSTGTITVSASFPLLVLSVPVQAELRPTVTGGKLAFQVVKANAFVFGVPTEYAQNIVDTMSSSTFPPLFNKLDFTTLRVTDSGVDFAVTGTDVPLNQETLGPADGRNNSQSCSI